MKQIIIAPSLEIPKNPTVFLGGGITNCDDWQSKVCECFDDSKSITVFNPRRANFNVFDRTATAQQIDWEFSKLEKCDIFSMYFCNSDSVQPICLYELGRNVIRMQNRFPTTWERRIIVSIEEGYKRTQDVIIQMAYAMPGVFIDSMATPEFHAKQILLALEYLRRKGEVTE